jgi:hypothetical protein
VRTIGDFVTANGFVDLVKARIGVPLIDFESV